MPVVFAAKAGDFAEKALAFAGKAVVSAVQMHAVYVYAYPSDIVYDATLNHAIAFVEKAVVLSGNAFVFPV